MSAKLMSAVDSVSARTNLVWRCVPGMSRQSIVASLFECQHDADARRDVLAR